jgi:hypothetical protein
VVASNWRLVSTLSDMGSKGTADYRRRRKEAERRRPVKADRTAFEPTLSTAVDHGRRSPERRAAATDCAWCGGPITRRSRGPIPKWCSATCRHRAWEQTRAAASGRSAVEVVERRVKVPVPVTPARRDWPGLLEELARQIEDGRVYNRDLLDLSDALNTVLESYRRHPYVRSGSVDHQRQAQARRRARRGLIG